MIDASLAELNRLLQPTSQLPDPCAEVSECLLNLTPAVMAGLSDSEIHSLFSRCHARFPQATLAACDEQDPAPFHRALMESRAPKLLQRLDRIHAGQDQWGSDEIEAVAKRCIDYVEGRAVPPDDFDEQLDAFAVEHGLDCVRITQEWLTDDNWKDLLVRSLSNRHWNARLQLEIIVCLSHFEGLLDEAAELLTDNSERRDRLVDLGRRLSTFRGALSWLPDGSGTIARVEGLPPDAIQLVLQCIPVTHLELIGVKEKGTNQKPNDYDSDSDIEDDEDPTPSASLGAVLEEFASTGEGLHSLTLKNCTLKGDGSDLLLGLQHNGKLRHLKIDNAKWDAILPGNGLFSKLHSLENLESLTVRQTELFADCWLALPRIKKLRKLKLDVKLTHQEDNAVSNFFALLGSMPHLQSLKIDQLSRRIATSDWEMLSDFLADENCRLEHLAIGGPGLNDLRASTVAKGLASNKSLQSLLIRSPCLIHSGWGVLAAAMKKQGRLKNLFLRFCKMSSKAASDIIETAPELSALESLKLRGCEILGPSDHLADVLAKGRNLRLFHMDQMDTSSEFYSRLGQALNVTTSCQQLNVPITAKDPEQVIDAFAAALDANRTLEGFTLSEGMFGLSLVAPPIDGLAARTLIKALSRCEGLRRINLTGIELSDTCVQAVLTKLVDCANLESLTIRVEGLSKGLEDGLDTLLHEGSKIQSLVIAPPLTMHGSWSRRSSYLVPGAIGRALGKRVPLHKLTIDDIVLEGAELAAFKENAEVHQGQA